MLAFGRGLRAWHGPLGYYGGGKLLGRGWDAEVASFGGVTHAEPSLRMHLLQRTRAICQRHQPLLVERYDLHRCDRR